jgi:sugar lactone lactonase YvrE
MSYKIFASHRTALLLTAIVFAGSATLAAQTFAPPAVATSSTVTTYSNANFAGIQAVDVDASGNVYFAVPGNGQLYEQPANGGTPVVLYTLASGGGGYPKGLAVDHIGNAYITDYSGHLWQVSISTGAATDILAACGPLDGYYLGTQSVAVDGSNNVYVTGNNEASIFKITPAGVCSIVATGDDNSFVAADGLGNIFFSVGSTNIDELPVGSTTSTQIANGFSAILGLRADALGNLFVTDASTIDELPYVSGAVSASAKFSVLANSSASSVGVGATGLLYTTNSSSITESSIGSLGLGSSAVGTATATGTVTLLFNSAQKLSSLKIAEGASTATELVNTGAGTCVTGASFTAGASCTLTFTLTPGGIGARREAVQIFNGTAQIGSVAVSAQGTGAGLTIDPGTQIALGTTWSAPDGIAVDTAGNTFVADKTAGTVSLIAAGSTTATVLATGLNSPASIGVAGDGSVYVANTGAATLVKIPHSNGAYGATVIAASGFKTLAGVAVGNGGSVYVADAGAGKIYRYPNSAGTVDFSTQQTLGSGFIAPTGLTVDANGNVFVTDKSAGTVIEITGVTQTTAVSGLNSPIAIAVIPSGALFVALSGSATIEEIPFVSGSYNLNSTSQLGTALSTPSALALDPAGNLYIADSSLPGVVEVERTAGALNLGRFNIGQSSATQSFALSDSGTASTALGSPLYTVSGNTSDFAVTTTGTGACSGGGVLATGTSCSVSATFSPTATGTRTETLTFNSNAVNASSETGTLTGTGINLPKTTTTLTQITPSPISFGEAVQVSAAVVPQSGTGTPTGTVQFYVNGNAYGLGVTLTNGTAAQTITGLPAGSDAISAVYSGDNNFAGSTATTLTTVVSLAPTTTTLTSTVSSASPVPPGTSVTLTATISSAVTSSAPSGTVAFIANGQTLATEPVSGGIATYTTTTLPNGTYAVTAVYSGDAGFATSTSNSVTVSILPPSYVISNAPTSLSVNAPGSVTASFVVTPISGYTGGVDISCSGLPANTTCAFVPATIEFANTINSSGATVSPSAQTIQLTITTDQAPASTAAWLWPIGSMSLIAFAFSRKRRKLALPIILALFTLVSGLGLTGCGNGTPLTPAGSTTVTVNFVGTPTGTSTIPTNGTGNIPNSFSFTLQVR